VIAVALAMGLVAVDPPADLAETCDDLDLRELAATLEDRADKLEALDGKMPVRIGKRRHGWREYARGTLRPLAKLARDAESKAEFCRALVEDYAFHRERRAGDGLFTVYYDPEVRGSREKRGDYAHPLHRRPADPELASLTSEQVLAGGLDGHELEIVWLADPTEVQLAQIEGSATVRLDDGGVVRLTVDGSNGRPYRNVSKLLLADDKIPDDQVTPLGMTRARKYFLDNPDELPIYRAKNPRWVFFKDSDGPRGKLGPLAAGRSVAVDLDRVPLGAAVLIRTDRPVIDEGDTEITAWESYARVAIAEDTGAAIRGPARVDVFFGAGAYAAQCAASVARPGEIYVLVKKK
jgi:membrane-bound lytic murein transglycosylase A